MVSSVQSAAGAELGIETPPVAGATPTASTKSFSSLIEYALARNPGNGSARAAAGQSADKMPRRNLPSQKATRAGLPDGATSSEANTQDSNHSTDSPRPLAKRRPGETQRSPGSEAHAESIVATGLIVLRPISTEALPSAAPINVTTLSISPAPSGTSPGESVIKGGQSATEFLSAPQAGEARDRQPNPDSASAHQLGPFSSSSSQQDVTEQKDATAGAEASQAEQAIGEGPPNDIAAPRELASTSAPSDKSTASAAESRSKPALHFGHGPPAVSAGKEYPPGLGISVAQQESPMKKAEKEQKTAEASQQDLPGSGPVLAEQGLARTGKLAEQAPSADFEKVLVAAAPEHTKVAPETPITLGQAADARLSALEKTHDLVALHAVRLSQSGNDSVRVVLEPGGGTRLSLDLRFQSGAIEAQAVLHRGDFQFLSSHWSDLQQRLATRGVQLGGLECATDTKTGQEQFRQGTHQHPDDGSTRSAFAEFALDGAMADSPARRRERTKTHAGWETWA